MKPGESFWQRSGSTAFLLLAVFVWSTLFWSPEERSSRTLSSETTAYGFYLTGNYQASYDTLMRTELQRRPLNESSMGALERLILDLYMEPSLKLGPQKAADAFNLLLSRSDVPAARRAIWETYEAELLTLHKENYSVSGFLNRVEGLQLSRKAASSERPLNVKTLQKINEGFRVYFIHALKKWHEEKNEPTPTLRWLFAAGFSGSMYYAQGREQLEEFLERCRQVSSCLPADITKSKEVLRLIVGLDEPIDEERP